MDEQGLPGIYGMVKSKVWLLTFKLRVTVSSRLLLGAEHKALHLTINQRMFNFVYFAKKVLLLKF